MLYLLYGPDTFRSRQKLNEIILRAENLHRDKLTLRKIDLSEENIDVLGRELETPSLFSPFRFVVLNNAADKEIVKKLQILIDKHGLVKSKESIIVVHEENLEEKNVLVQLITEKGKTQKFEHLSKPGIVSWITSFFLSRKTKIDSDAVKKLAEGIGPDLWRINNECEKLAAWAANMKTGISVRDVSELVIFENESNIFAITDGVLAKNSAKAVYDLEILITRGEDVTGVFYLLVKQFQSLSQIFALAQRGPMPTNLAKILNIHPYVATKLLASLRKWPEGELKAIFNSFAAHDLAIKTGAQDARLALTMLAAKLNSSLGV